MLHDRAWFISSVRFRVIYAVVTTLICYFVVVIFFNSHMNIVLGFIIGTFVISNIFVFRDYKKYKEYKSYLIKSNSYE